MNFDAAADLMSIFANSKRLVVLSLISKGELCVGDLAKHTGLSQSALSQHLAVMRNASLVTTRRDAQTVYYSCSSREAITLLGAIDSLFTPSLPAAMKSSAVSASR